MNDVPYATFDYGHDNEEEWRHTNGFIALDDPSSELLNLLPHYGIDDADIAEFLMAPIPKAVIHSCDDTTGYLLVGVPRLTITGPHNIDLPRNTTIFDTSC
jgi:hypothetical protein